MKTTLFALTGLLAVAGSAMAQQAPHVCGAGPGPDEVMAGMQPGGNGVAPTPLCYWKSGSQEAAAPTVRWEDRWGAIAVDNSPAHAVYGIVTDQPSKRIAQKAAVSECKNRGGRDCAVSLSYHNQCAAVGAGNAGTFPHSAATVEEASRLAMQRCEAASGKGACWIYYSGCSLPVQVQ